MRLFKIFLKFDCNSEIHFSDTVCISHNFIPVKWPKRGQETPKCTKKDVYIDFLTQILILLSVSIYMTNMISRLRLKRRKIENTETTMREPPEIFWSDAQLFSGLWPVYAPCLHSSLLSYCCELLPNTKKEAMLMSGSISLQRH